MLRPMQVHESSMGRRVVIGLSNPIPSVCCAEGDHELDPFDGRKPADPFY